MEDEITVIGFYGQRDPSSVAEALSAVFESSGESPLNPTESTTVVRDGISVNVHPYAHDFESEELLLRIEVGGAVWPWNSRDDETYQQVMDSIFEMMCGVVIHLEPDYVTVFESEKHGMGSVPKEKTIENGIEQPPVIGIYSDAALEHFGDIETLYDGTPYYTARLSSGQTLVIESPDPWQQRGWTPPIDAEYVDSATIDDPSSGETIEGRSWGLSDPFAALSEGEYGTDVCIDRDDIAAEFANDTLQFVPVYVDGAGNLRRIADDSFVRNVVTEQYDDERETIKAMLAEIPIDADEDDPMVSALLHEAIPPAFVRIDGPDDDNVVMRVLDLDVSVNKIELLISLGKALAAGSLEDEGIETAEEALDTLLRLEAAGEIDEWIQEHLLV